MARIAELETKRLVEQDRLDQLKDASERNKLGQFATPNPLAVAIASHLLKLRGENAGPIRFLDPAVGSGSFFSALMQVVGSEEIERASGIEIDPVFASLASKLWSTIGLEVTPGDLTRLDPSSGQRANLILANPPYIRHHHLGLKDKRRLQERVRLQLDIRVSGLAGLYVHFLLLCDAWLEDGGLAAWLIPSEFMDTNYGKAIKDYLTQRVRLHQIHRFRPSDAQFGDALVTSAVVIFEKTRPDEASTVLLSYGGSLDSPDLAERLPIVELRAARKWTNFPRNRDARVDSLPSAATLGDLFTIRRGLVTGANDFFIVPRVEATEKGLPDQFLRPILPGPRSLKDTIIEADIEGNPIVDPSLVLIDCDRPEEEIERDHPSLWAYFQEGVARGLDLCYLTSRRSPWYSQERREPPPFVCTYMGRHREGRPPFRFLRNRSKAVAANVYLLLYPKGMLLRLIESKPELVEVVFEWLQQIRPSHFIDEGRVYGGGLHKMEPKELAALPADAILEAIGQPAATRQAKLVGLSAFSRIQDQLP